MRLLLDTHIFLWAVAGSSLLKPAARRLIESADEVYVSAASIWEVAIKARLGKIDANPHELAAAIDASGFLELPITAAHAAGVAQLEFHHNDPFDRLLIAQALAEPLKFVTVDAVLAKYSDVVLLVGDIGRP
jgi:PIN domain nuclease of toxin-antitoxin system